MSLVDAVKDAGIIGCGGAGFPTHVKINAKVDTVIANGAECEPLLNSDQRVMEEYAAELITGMKLVMKNVGASKGYIGLKRTYEHAIAALHTKLKKKDGIQLHLLDNTYPSGDEQILVTEVTGMIVPEGGIPLAVGVVVSNVLTFVQIARAEKGKPVTERAVTVVGEVVKPQVLSAAIGTSLKELLKVVIPKIPEDETAVIEGGPMMGKLSDLDAVVNKTSSGFIILPKDHPLVMVKSLPMETIIRRSVAACCQCRMCTEACSRYMQGHSIEPHLMMRGLGHPDDKATYAMTAAFICSQCGLCEWACPMDLSPRRAYAELLQSFNANGMKNPHTNAPEEPHEFREYRKIGKDRLTRRYKLSKYESHELPLSKMDPPKVVKLALKQSIGAPSKPVVKVGAKVKKGDLVAGIPKGKLGSNLHASIAGEVTSVKGGFVVVEAAKGKGSK